MEDATGLLGKNIRGKVCRHKWPIMTGRVVDTRNALFGNVRVQFEDGTQAPMIYPHIETLD